MKIHFICSLICSVGLVFSIKGLAQHTKPSLTEAEAAKQSAESSRFYLLMGQLEAFDFSDPKLDSAKLKPAYAILKEMQKLTSFKSAQNIYNSAPSILGESLLTNLSRKLLRGTPDSIAFALSGIIRNLLYNSGGPGNEDSPAKQDLKKMMLENNPLENVSIGSTKQKLKISENPYASDLMGLYLDTLDLDKELSQFKPYLDSKTRRVFMAASEALSRRLMVSSNVPLSPETISSMREHFNDLAKEASDPKRDWGFIPGEKEMPSIIESRARTQSSNGLKMLAERQNDLASFKALVRQIPLLGQIDTQKQKEVGESSYAYEFLKNLDSLTFFNDQGKNIESTKRFITLLKQLTPDEKAELSEKLIHLLRLPSSATTQKKLTQTLGLLIDDSLPNPPTVEFLKAHKGIINPAIYDLLMPYLTDKNTLAERYRKIIDKVESARRNGDQTKLTEAEINEAGVGRFLQDTPDRDLIRMAFYNSVHPNLYELGSIQEESAPSRFNGGILGGIFGGLAIVVGGTALNPRILGRMPTGGSRDTETPTLLLQENEAEVTSKALQSLILKGPQGRLDSRELSKK
jgi:hypothetical protein